MKSIIFVFALLVSGCAQQTELTSPCACLEKPINSPETNPNKSV